MRHVVGGVDVTEHIRKAVDAAPPLTAEQRDRIAILLRRPAITKETHPCHPLKRRPHRASLTPQAHQSTGSG